MTNTEASALYPTIQQQVEAAYKAGVLENPGAEMMVMLVPSAVPEPLAIPVEEFRQIIRGRMPDLLQKIDQASEPDSFWFAIVTGDWESSSIFLKAVRLGEGWTKSTN